MSYTAVVKRFAVVVYGDHAKEQMQKRKVRSSQVEKCLETPDSERPSRKGRTVAEQKTLTGATLRVVYKVTKNNVAFVTTVVRKGR
jgi:Domain of unknown function (DUF4258)